jgi:hypothetical protein
MSTKIFFLTLFIAVFGIKTSSAQYTEFWINGTDSRHTLEIQGSDDYTINALFDGVEDPTAVYEWYIGFNGSGGLGTKLEATGKTIQLYAEDINWVGSTWPYYWEHSQAELTCKITVSGNSYTETFVIYNDEN